MRSDNSVIRAVSRSRSAVLATMLAIAVSAGATLSAAGEQRVRGEYEVKAALVYNFLKFVEWPSQRTGSDIRLCVVGNLSRAQSLARLDNQVVAGRRLTIVAAEPEEAHGCDVLFLLKGEERRLPRVLAAVRGGSTLTVGEADGLIFKGVMVNFIVVENKVRFQINADAARSAGITISSKLIKLAAPGVPETGGE